MAELRDIVRGRTAVLGIGNVLRADDGAGSRVATALCSDFPDVTFDGGQAPENFLGPLRRAKPDTIIIVDAADFGGVAGEVRIVRADELQGMMVATHGAPIGMIMRALSEETGAATVLVAIQASVVSLGEPMSEEVAGAAERVTEMLRGLLEERRSVGA